VVFICKVQSQFVDWPNCRRPNTATGGLLVMCFACSAMPTCLTSNKCGNVTWAGSLLLSSTG